MKLPKFLERRRHDVAEPEPAGTGARPVRLPPLHSDHRRGIKSAVVDATRGPKSRQVMPLQEFSIPAPAPGVVPAGALAMDSMAGLADGYNWALQGLWAEGLGFLGYPYLAELTQRPEYRRASEIIAKEMTRRWIKLSAVGEAEDKADKIKALDDAMREFDVQALFRQAAEQDGFYGRSQLYISLANAPPRDPERAKPLILDSRKIDKGSLQYFKLMEPYWVYPGAFNADRPTEPDFYKPTRWYVMGEEIHVSRLLLFVSRQMPDILKPAYQFGGLSLSQMGKPYVDNWLETRQSVNGIVNAFSVMVLKTDLSQLFGAGGSAQSLNNRLSIFNNYRDNSGVFAVDKESEDFENVAAPIAGLHELQAQAQEHMSSVFGIPLVIYLGITPSGLNASSDGEIKTFYAWIKAQQEHLFRPNLKVVLDVLQLHLFGEIDPEIGFQFVPLWEPSEKEVSEINKADADTDVAYVNAGVLSPEEVRKKLAADEDSPYHGIDVADVPEPPMDPALEGDPEDEEDDPPPGGAQDATPGWEEGKHPRRTDGKFGKGGGPAGGAKPAIQHETRPKPGAQKPLISATHYGENGTAAWAAKHDQADVKVADVLAHFPPDTAATLQSYADRVDAGRQTAEEHKDAEGNYTSERQALHHEWLFGPDGVVSPEALERAKPAPGEAPTFTVLGGRGGSGKSSLKGKVYDPEKAIMLDADHFKSLMPEYEGWNAGLTHDESSELVQAAMDIARHHGVNIVIDGTMKTPAKAVKQVEDFKADGYRIEAHYMHLPRQEAAKRAVERALGDTKRFVPPSIVLSNTENEKSFDMVRQLADAWSVHDNMVPRGEPPRLVSSSAS